jgi:hypothetical protein
MESFPFVEVLFHINPPKIATQKALVSCPIFKIYNLYKKSLKLLPNVWIIGISFINDNYNDNQCIYHVNRRGCLRWVVSLPYQMRN